MSAGVLTIVGGIITALVTGGLGYAVARLNADTSRSSAITAPYEALAQRVTDLETNIQVVITDRNALVSYVSSLAAWFQGGAKPPAPKMPAFLTQHLDPGAFDIAHITERTTTTTTRYSTPEGD